MALFTSSNQVDNLFCLATEMGQAQAAREALRNNMVVAAIGPVTTEALHAHGVEPDLCPTHPKMGHLLAEVAQHATDLVLRKRRGESVH